MLCCSKKKLEKMIGAIIEATVQKEMGDLTEWLDELQGSVVHEVEMSEDITALRTSVAECEAKLNALADAAGIGFEFLPAGFVAADVSKLTKKRKR